VAADYISRRALAQWHSISHSRPHSPSEAGRKTRPLPFVTQRVTATLIANRVPQGASPRFSTEAGVEKRVQTPFQTRRSRMWDSRSSGIDCYESDANANMLYRISRCFRRALSIGNVGGIEVPWSCVRDPRTATGAVDDVAFTRNADASRTVSPGSRISPHEV